MISYENVSLYVYGLTTILCSVITTLVYTQVDVDSYVLPVVINLFFYYIVISIYIINNAIFTISRIQRISVACGVCVGVYLINNKLWDDNHFFCCVSGYIISLCYMLISVFTLSNKDMFGREIDSRRLLLPFSTMFMALFPIDPYHESIILFQVILFLISFFVTLAFLIYTENSIIMDKDCDPFWYMICVHVPILMMNKYMSCIYSVILIVVTSRQIGDKYIRDITLSKPDKHLQPKKEPQQEVKKPLLPPSSSYTQDPFGDFPS